MKRLALLAAIMLGAVSARATDGVINPLDISAIQADVSALESLIAATSNALIAYTDAATNGISLGEIHNATNEVTAAYLAAIAGNSNGVVAELEAYADAGDGVTSNGVVGEMTAYTDAATNGISLAEIHNATNEVTAAYLAADGVISNGVVAELEAYADAADTVISNGVVAELEAYADAGDTVISNGVVSELEAYADAADTVISNGVVAYADAADVVTSNGVSAYADLLALNSGFLVYSSTNMVIASGTYLKLPYDTTAQDTDSGWADYEYTVPASRTGEWLFGAVAVIDDLDAGDVGIVQIKQVTDSGATTNVVCMEYGYSAGTATSLHLDAEGKIADVSSGDVFYVEAYHNEGAEQVLASDLRRSFWGVWLGE